MGIVLSQGVSTDRSQRADPSLRRGKFYYRWCMEYSGLMTHQARRMKDPENENLRLRQAISDWTLDKLILREAAGGNSRARLGADAALTR